MSWCCKTFRQRGCREKEQGGAWPDNAKFNELFEHVKNVGYDINKRRGCTPYVIGLAMTEIVQAILHGQERILTVSNLVNGFYHIHNVCLSLPSVVNGKGVVIPEAAIVNVELGTGIPIMYDIDVKGQVTNKVILH